jgi:hypothetical protein
MKLSLSAMVLFLVLHVLQLVRNAHLARVTGLIGATSDGRASGGAL